MPTDAFGAIETVKRPKAVPPDSSYARCAGSEVATIAIDDAKRDACAKIGCEKRRGVRRHSSVELVAIEAAAHAEQLILSKYDQAFIMRIVSEADKLHDFGIDRDFLAANVGHIYKGDHAFSLTYNMARRAVARIGACLPCFSFACEAR